MEMWTHITSLSKDEVWCRNELGHGEVLLDRPPFNRPADSNVQSTIAVTRIGNDDLLDEDIFLADEFSLYFFCRSPELCSGGGNGLAHRSGLAPKRRGGAHQKSQSVRKNEDSSEWIPFHGYKISNSGS